MAEREVGKAPHRNLWREALAKLPKPQPAQELEYVLPEDTKEFMRNLGMDNEPDFSVDSDQVAKSTPAPQVPAKPVCPYCNAPITMKKVGFVHTDRRDAMICTGKYPEPDSTQQEERGELPYTFNEEVNIWYQPSQPTEAVDPLPEGYYVELSDYQALEAELAALRAKGEQVGMMANICPGCEGKPVYPNNPCSICGTAAKPEPQQEGASLEEFDDWYKDHHNQLAFEYRNQDDLKDVYIFAKAAWLAARVASTSNQNGVEREEK
jgi:hypothetical protein